MNEQRQRSEKGLKVALRVEDLKDRFAIDIF